MASATPLEEGNDPLSIASTPGPSQSASGKKAEAKVPFTRLISDSVDPSWGRELNGDISNGARGADHDDQGATRFARAPEVSSDSKIDSRNGIKQSEGDEDDSEEEFVYPGGSESAQTMMADTATEKDASFPARLPVTDGARRETGHTSHYTSGSSLVEQTASTSPAKPIDYMRLSQLCSQGPLSSLKSFFASTTLPAPEGSGVSAFTLANEPNPASGLAPIHYAVRDGKVDVLKWLVKEAGALVEMEDREGETALHKASLAGKLPALTFLLSCDADANVKDVDGWTPLHNACSRGYLDIVKVLVETSGAALDVKGGRGSWTPLMNASSHGHLPIVRYLTSKHHADPFIRNTAGETAYDVAAATFEIYICEVLERYESERWAALKFALGESAGSKQESGNGRLKMVPGQGPYNPLALHTTVPIVLHENQRLDTRLSTLAIRGGKPRWSGTQAGRPDKSDRRAPGTMPPGPLSLSRTRNIPMRRDDVRLPTRKEPYKARLSNRSAQIAAARRARGEVLVDELASTPTPESVLNSRNDEGQQVSSQDELSHFWLSDWQIDLTHPLVDAEQGWQYSQSLDTQEEKWLATPPPTLSRLVEGRGLGQSVQRAVILATGSSSASAVEAEAVNSDWVRRRRWVRVMRRRLDIEFGDELEAAEQASSSLAAAHGQQRGGILTSALVYEAQQAGRSDAEGLGPEADYLSRSRAMAGSSPTTTRADLVNQGEDNIRRQITRLELAVNELRSFAFVDDDATRQGQAEELLKDYTLQLGYLRQAAGLEEGSEDGEDDDDDEFIYPNSYKDDGQSIITRIGTPSVTNSGIVPPRIRSTPSEAGTSMAATRSADLANAMEFRVPTNEVPHRAVQYPHQHGYREQNLLPTWEHDGDAVQCRGCNRKFTFFLRKHHCRRCGRIYCDGCSSHRAHLSPSELVIDPGVPEMMLLESSGPTRICDACDAESRLPRSLRNARGLEAMTEALSRIDSNDSGISDVSSRISELNDCPVCGTVLATLGESIQQEEHIQACLENGGGGGSVQGSRYLIYKLTEGPIVGKECQICLEDLCIGMTIARLPCLCYYHRHW